MEYQKITNLLGTTLDEIPRFITKKWVEVHDQSGSAEDRYKPSKQIRFKTSMLRSDLCDFSDAHIVVKGDITLTKTNTRGFIDTRNRFLAFKNNASFTNCISKNNNVFIDKAVDLDIVMPIYNLLEYSKNYRKMMTSLLLLITMQTPQQILSLLNTKVVLQEKHNLLDYEYFSKHYKLIVIDLSKQIELENRDLRQQIIFLGKLEDDKATMFFIIEKSKETTFELLQNSVSII